MSQCSQSDLCSKLKLSLDQIQFHELITAIGINKLRSTMSCSNYLGL